MLIEDYVCGMQVNEGENQIMYRGGAYSFCSMQCRERFQANPHLYVGLPGQKAPKQEGRSVIKQRRLRLAQPLSSGQEKMLVDALQTMMGIQAVSAEGERVAITYDLLQATEEQIENKLAEIGIQLGEGFADRLRRAFVHYEEECEAGNLEVHADDIEPLYEAFRRDER
ncbi:YHS domain-containing protein [Candidatus Ferrigenium straubiae]|jgi:YHS domain-containing protein|uniref:YHS domain-containing protein n=1 Tax=Candidatus Ferrigenium straubiae TaxID=2919506 RepID=UPI003F4A93B7